MPTLKKSGRNAQEAADELLKRRTSKSFSFRRKTILFFETEIFNFGGSNREKKFFALWKIYIRLTNRSPSGLFEAPSKLRQPFCKVLLVTMLRDLKLEEIEGVENRKPMWITRRLWAVTNRQGGVFPQVGGDTDCLEIALA